MLVSVFSAFSNLLHLVLGISTPQNFPPPLSAEEECEYFRQLEHGDESARQKLISHNLRLVSHIVRKYYSGNKCSEDLVSIGVIGLVKAVDSFRLQGGAKFATYAAKCIQNEILMYFRSQKRICSEVSLSDTIDVDRDGNPLTYIDVISTEDSLEEDVDRVMQSRQALKLVRTALSERERKIIELRYGLNGKKALTQREVASLLGISRSYVSRIEKSALDTLFKLMTT